MGLGVCDSWLTLTEAEPFGRSSITGDNPAPTDTPGTPWASSPPQARRAEKTSVRPRLCRQKTELVPDPSKSHLYLGPGPEHFFLFCQLQEATYLGSGAAFSTTRVWVPQIPCCSPYLTKWVLPKHRFHRPARESQLPSSAVTVAPGMSRLLSLPLPTPLLW